MSFHLPLLIHIPFILYSFSKHDYHQEVFISKQTKIISFPFEFVSTLHITYFLIISYLIFYAVYILFLFPSNNYIEGIRALFVFVLLKIPNTVSEIFIQTISDSSLVNVFLYSFHVFFFSYFISNIPHIRMKTFI